MNRKEPVFKYTCERVDQAVELPLLCELLLDTPLIWQHRSSFWPQDVCQHVSRHVLLYFRHFEFSLIHFDLRRVGGSVSV